MHFYKLHQKMSNQVSRFKLVPQFWLPAKTVRHIWLPLRLSMMQVAESCGQSWQEAIYHVQKSKQEARDCGQSQ